MILQFRIKEADVNCQSLSKYEKLLWFYVFQDCMFFIQSIQVIQKLKDPPNKKLKICQTQKKAESLRNLKNSLKIS